MSEMKRIHTDMEVKAYEEALNIVENLPKEAQVEVIKNILLGSLERKDK